MALWLRSDAGFQGITRSGTVHKVSLYADDLLLYVSDPNSSFPTIFNILDEYSSVSRYKLNYQKSEILPINDLAKQLPHSIVPFKWSTNGLHYLGIHITTSLSDLYCNNLAPLVEKTEGDFDRWSTLPLSLVGRINLIKMVVHLPVLLTKSFFDTLDKKISTLLWNGKPARIRKSILQSPKDRGGFALPVFRHYYLAANMQKLLFWLCEDQDSMPCLFPFSLRSILCAQLPPPVSNLASCSIVAVSLKIWC